MISNDPTNTSKPTSRARIYIHRPRFLRCLSSPSPLPDPACQEHVLPSPFPRFLSLLGLRHPELRRSFGLETSGNRDSVSPPTFEGSPHHASLQNSTLSLSLGERELISLDAITELTSRINTTTGIVDGLSADFPWEAASFFSVWASNDWISGNKTYEVAVTSGIQQYQDTNPNFFNQTSNSFTLSWGLAAFYSYRAYNQSIFLDLAVSLWDSVFPYSVIEADALSGKHPLRTIAIPSVCNRSSTAGAVFRFTDPSTLEVDTDSVGRFLALSSTVPFARWTRPDGIVYEGGATSSDIDGFDNALKGFFIPGLHEAWRRSGPDSPMAEFIEGFITVQLGTLLDFAADPQSHVFGPVWEGPPVSAFHALPQITALQVLNPALDITRRRDTPTNRPSPLPKNPPSSSTHASRAGAVVGGVIGGIAGLLGIVALLFFLVRRRRRRSERFDARDTSNSKARRYQEAAIIEPFTPGFMDPTALPPRGKRPYAYGSPSSTTQSSQAATSAPTSQQDGSAESPMGNSPAELLENSPRVETQELPDRDAIPPILREFMEEIRAMIQDGHAGTSPPRYE
ncbi:hypothetical protein OF83DRAFT_1293816 [Amylostereum chailletii]|nr:hypothetical protein OF83DRAFT_1293816 [Amylostereum chailletii]